MRAAQFLAIIGRGSKGSNALELTEDRAGATSEQQDNVINAVNSLDPYGPSLQLVPGNVAAGTVYAQVPTSGAGDLTFSRASNATRVNASGLIETVANNVPRLDYLGSSFPRLLLEPQRTNLAQYSEQFDNAYWLKAGTTILPNNTTSPDGYDNADKLTSTGAGGDQYIQRDGFTTTAGTYTSSIFVKNVNATVTVLMAVHLGEGSITSDMRYTWSTNTFTLNGTNAVAGKVTNYGNGWFRLEFTYTIGATVIGHWFRTYVQTGVSTNSIFIYGAEVEAGAYATSYIPTTTAAMTRVADAASKTGISSLIGQTEGTLFMDFEFKYADGIKVFISIHDSNNSKRIEIWANDSVLYGFVGASAAFNMGPITATNNTRYKAAIAYKSGDSAFYINGTQIAVNNTAFTITLTGLIYDYWGSGYVPNTTVGQTLLFKTRLTNAQLAELTTL